MGILGDDVNPFLADSDLTAGNDFQAAAELSTGLSQMYVTKEEPEFMRKWKQEQQERLRKKDDEETAAKEELKMKAKQELEDWYKRYESQIEKTKTSPPSILSSVPEPVSYWSTMTSTCW